MSRNGDSGRTRLHGLVLKARYLGRAYPVLLRFAWERAAAYRAVFVVALMNAAFPLVMMAIWIELARESPVAGFTTGDFVAYYLAAVLVRRLTAVGIVNDLERLIRSGELSPHLLRPLHVGHVFFARALVGRGFIVLLLMLAVGVGVALTPGARFDLRPVSLALFVVACAIGLLFEFFVQFSIGSLGFWLTQVQGIAAAFQFVKAFLGGYIVPLALFPSGLAQWLVWTPFPISVALPVEILTGQADAAQVSARLIVGALWTLLTAVGARQVWRAGVRAYAAVGA
ncbi:MAG: ABC-2 family transporter protein [Thermoflexales bacterium]|nr:ABC-2 family transporter protein [Thermoflexales bacterium]MDW8350587.1 ABC-2 family transporter protein [Anaerolineae bacterium]